MVDYLAGATFDNQSVTPKNDGKWYRKIMGDGVVAGCALTSSTDKLTIAAGGIIIAGRYMELTSPTTLTIDGATTGYAQVKIVLDTTATATTIAFEQAYFAVVYKSDTAFVALTQDDINATGTDYEFELCTVSLDAGGIDEILTYSAADSTKIKPESASADIIEVTADKTLAWPDRGALLKVNSASPVVVTIPLNSVVAFPIGTEQELVRYGAGSVTIGITGGGTIVAAPAERTIKNQYTSIIIKKVDTDTWLLQGNLG